MSDRCSWPTTRRPPCQRHDQTAAIGTTVIVLDSVTPSGRINRGPPVRSCNSLWPAFQMSWRRMPTLDRVANAMLPPDSEERFWLFPRNKA